MIFSPIIPQDLRTTASPTFADLTLSGLTASQAIMTDASKQLVSVDYLNQAVKTTSSPTFANITDSGLTAGRVTYAGTAGLLTDSANLTFDGDDLTCTGDIFASNLLPTTWNLKADYAFGANSFTGSGDFSGGAILGTTVEAENGFIADGTPAVADGTYTVGKGTAQDGTITVKGGIITAVQEASDV